MILSLTYIAIVLNDPIGLNVNLAEFCYLFNELTEVSVKASIDTFKFWVFVVFLSHFNSSSIDISTFFCIYGLT